MKKIQDLDCGNQKKTGSIRIYINPDTIADILHDLDILPYSFEGSTFDENYADNVIEYLDNFLKVMERPPRISKPHGIIVIKLPYFRSRYACIGPTHSHYFIFESFTFFDLLRIHHALHNYSKCLFITMKIVFDDDFPKVGLKELFLMPILRFCNKYSVFYERHLSHIFPLDELTFYLKIIKSEEN